MELGFRISMVSTIPIFLSCNFGFQNPGFQIPGDKILEFRIPDQTFHGLRNPDSLTKGNVMFIIGTHLVLPWVPEDFFFLSIQIFRGEAVSTRREAPRDVNERRKKQKSVWGTLSNRKNALFHCRQGGWQRGLEPSLHDRPS